MFFQIDNDDDHSSQPSQSQTHHLLGFIIANIVGTRYYPGYISGREMVGLVREPLNPYDSNAIKVLNTQTIQVGHIERSVAAVLAPLIDSNDIVVEGIVPNSRSKGKIPCQVHIFAAVYAFPTLKELILSSGLQLISDSDAAFTMSDSMAVKETRAEKRGRSVDDIFKLVDETNRNRGLEDLVPSKSVIKTELLKHQKEGLWWLVRRENSDELPLFWEERDGNYVNVLTNYKTNARPEPLRGGIFADDMGLGKTLTLLSLIAFDKEQSIGNTSHEVRDEGSSLSIKKGKRGRVSNEGSGSQKRRKIMSHSLDDVSIGKEVCVADTCSIDMKTKTTLVVCPTSVLSTWISQLEEHTKRGSLKAYLYYGNRTKDADELKMHDLVLTTYAILSSEETSSDSPLKKLEWWRIILDEAHTIKNVNAQQSKAAIKLNAKRRWAVTGTPIQNGSYDLFSIMAFLKFEPFSIKNYWRSLVQRPLNQGMEKGLSRLQVLMATISLRRTKDKGLVGLPSKTIETHYVELSVEERELYDLVKAESKRLMMGYINNGSLVNHYSSVLSMILRLRQICTDLALCPSDLKSVLSSANIEDVSNNPELLKALVEVLQDGEDFDCPICISPPTNIVITCCAHIYCRECILRTLQCSNPCCPLCRHPLSESDLFSAPPESSKTADAELSSSEPRLFSKASALIKLLIDSRDQNPTTKSVVFSQFRKMILLLEEPLKAAGFKTLRLDGNMNATQRAHVIKQFRVSGGEPMVMLASLKASSTGINLTAASRVYFMEPWWNPAVEEQAMDRVHRIGQKEDVKVVRLVAQNSIEERILMLQEKKKKLAREAFGKGSKDVGMGMEDVRFLLSQ
ncbi:hypothetical protein TanjilG_32897 [Lupinus angustifolius]|uniref:SWI/SNF-related matrix-associated actin-dependent regulator of chromatin subfamily A member 3-like 1 n=1 Tax=Lupinus angustifolius TaxID=3871 RepID=A0A4P1RPW5_LUPAN|nr:PREDICTED: putative SWI/SNF-related matrix-associated actin-dependent regulator of chromatin subfamily A member 3-like 1 [Lupinus angustifolius]OIW15493.1 hypothetical protein TanjilG_32897 [Lupinus angustifolius]